MLEAGTLRFVGVEGAFRDFDFAPFRSFSRGEPVRRMLRRLLAAGEIAAPTFAGITAERDSG